MSCIDNCLNDVLAYQLKEFGALDVICERITNNIRLHNERKNETYENMNVIEERIPYNVHFKKPFAPTYMEQLKQMETDGLVSLRWVGKMNNIRACADEIVLNDIVYS